MNRAFIGIGSNIDPYRNIKRAIDCLAREHRLVGTSSLTVTAPIGFSGQPDFVNGAALVETELGIDAFSRYCKALEQRLGRVRNANKFGPRTIDLDIVIWNDTVMDDDYHTRDFLKNAIEELRGMFASAPPHLPDISAD